MAINYGANKFTIQWFTGKLVDARMHMRMIILRYHTMFEPLMQVISLITMRISLRSEYHVVAKLHSI